MPSQSRPRWLEIEPLGEVTLVRFLVREVLDEEMIQSLGGELFALIEEAGCRRLVVDFHAVQKMTSPMLGKLRRLHDLLASAGGKLAFCRIHPAIQPGLDILHLPRSLMYDNEQEALQAVRPPA